MPWHSWFNAEIYDRFVRERPIYGWLNRTLVGLADVAGAERILDVACGTGATVLACLREMGPRAEIVGIDSSAEMIGVARANVLDPRAQFEVAPAAGVHRLEDTFDRVLCNAAFWQFPSQQAFFGSLASRARPGSRFVFNVPAERVLGEPAPIHPFQITLMQEITQELGSPLQAQAAKLDGSRLDTTAREHGFRLLSTERCDYTARQGELMELMSIPAMILPLTPGLSEERRQAVLQRAYGRSNPELEVAVPWIYFILERDRGA